MIADLHRHDDYSLFDGLGKPMEMARLAKEYGYEALGQTNHGTASGLVEHYLACKEAGIKPVLGVEVYFQPKFTKERKRYHLCVFVKNIKGYQNLNRMLSYANIHQYYYKPIITFELLERYKEGLIVSTACIAGYASNKISEGNEKMAYMYLKKLKQIFNEDVYVEIQPYRLSTEGLQEHVNEVLMKMAKKLEIKCILTSDSHYGREEDLDTYIKMHEMKKRSGIEKTYKERYMPKPGDFRRRFNSMHQDNGYFTSKDMYDAMSELVEKCEDNILDKLELTLPVFDENVDSEQLLLQKIKEGLKSRGKYTKEYWRRCKKEFAVIKEHGFHDYFLIVQDYVKFAKDNGIAVGPGRGSVCNSLVAYALHITDVDSLQFGLDFRRFLRMDKKKLPDIDIDFETSRRNEVISYLLKKYKGKAVQICSYGLFKVDNLLNDLFKVCGVDDKKEQVAIKGFVGQYIDPESKNFDYDSAQYTDKCKRYNIKYNNIIKHFNKMYKKVRYIGTHAAGVAIVGTNILNYTSVERHGNRLSSAYDLNNLERINAIKFDMLGLRTLSVIKELEQLTGTSYQDDWIYDDELFREFREERTDGIFQFERKAAAGILSAINCDCFEDVIAANALNRPGPLGLRMPEQYAYNKAHVDDMKKTVFFELTKDTYGTVVYQEQIMAVCRNIGKLEWGDADKVLKFMKGTNPTERALKEKEREESRILSLFIKGAKENGIAETEAKEIFSKMLTYTFNKGHATGYALIALILMYYKVHYPQFYWYVNMKYAPGSSEEWKYKCLAITSGSLVLTPHVNGSAMYSMVKVDGVDCILEGTRTIKNVGEKAALAIEEEKNKNGPYKDIDDFDDRLPKRVVNARVRQALKDAGALTFNKKRYFSNVEKYNISIMSR